MVALGRVLAASNEAGVWYGTAEREMGLSGWLLVDGILQSFRQ